MVTGYGKYFPFHPYTTCIKGGNFLLPREACKDDVQDFCGHHDKWAMLLCGTPVGKNLNTAYGDALQSVRAHRVHELEFRCCMKTMHLPSSTSGR